MGVMLKFHMHNMQLLPFPSSMLRATGIDRLISPQAAFLPFLAMIQFPIDFWTWRCLNRNLRERNFTLAE